MTEEITAEVAQELSAELAEEMAAPAANDIAAVSESVGKSTSAYIANRKEADRLRSEGKADAIAAVKELIETYDLDAADLGFEGSAGGRGRRRGRPRKGDAAVQAESSQGVSADQLRKAAEVVAGDYYG